MQAAKVRGAQEDEMHPDVKRATTGLMLRSSDLEDATGLKGWNMPSGVPVFGSILKEKDKLFRQNRGTVGGRCDWSSVGPDALFVSDTRLVFQSDQDCLAYYRSTISSHAELVFQDTAGRCFPRMVELEPNPGCNLLVGTEPRMFCGPSIPARQQVIASLTAGRSKEDAEHLVKLAEKAVHLLYLFCSGRVLCKLRVTTHNGLTPLGHAHALAQRSHCLAQRWQAASRPPQLLCSPPFACCCAVRSPFPVFTSPVLAS